jgi:hypothetical protein
MGANPSVLAMGLKGGMGWALRRARLEAKVGLAHRHSNPFQLSSNYSKSIQIKFKSSEICSNSNKFNKRVNSALLFEFKDII